MGEWSRGCEIATEGGELEALRGGPRGLESCDSGVHGSNKLSCCAIDDDDVIIRYHVKNF